jgi:hypothetical protein
VVTEPPAPEQMIWWNLRVGLCQRFKDEVVSVAMTLGLIFVAYEFALLVQMDERRQEESRNSPQYLRNFGLACWAQVASTHEPSVVYTRFSGVHSRLPFLFIFFIVGFSVSVDYRYLEMPIFFNNFALPVAARLPSRR